MKKQPRPVDRIRKLLSDALTTSGRHTEALVSHYVTTVERFQADHPEQCLVKAGKFVEATLKALYVHVGRTLPPPRKFKVEIIINHLANEDPRFDDTVRLLIPKACRFVFDLASNRGGRHDPHEIDPNQMDATAAVSACSWVLAELVRHSAKGRLAPSEAQNLVAAVVERKYPLVEDIDGRVYLEKGEKSAVDVALATLLRRHPARVSRDELKETICRHAPRQGAPRFTINNANVALSRISTLVDDDGTGNLRLLASGLAKAERITSPSDGGG